MWSEAVGFDATPTDANVPPLTPIASSWRADGGAWDNPPATCENEMPTAVSWIAPDEDGTFHLAVDFVSPSGAQCTSEATVDVMMI